MSTHVLYFKLVLFCVHLSIKLVLQPHLVERNITLTDITHKPSLLYTLDHPNQNSRKNLKLLWPRQIWLFYWCTQVKKAL